MNKKKLTVLIAIAALILGGVVILMALGYLPPSQKNDNAEKITEGETQPIQFGYTDAELLMSNVRPEQRKAVLSDEALFMKTIREEAARQSLLKAARESGIGQHEKIRYQMQRKSEDFLLDIYLKNRLQVAGLPKGFPTEQQIQNYYEKAKADFVLPERLPVWQIFWRVPPNASRQEIAEVVKQASAVSRGIKSGDLKFHVVAQAQSQHRPSARNGGFMGVLKVSDLQPDIKEKLLALKEGEISAPVRQTEGVHVFLRGEIIPRTQQTLEQVRDRIIQELNRVYREQQVKRLRELANSKYPAKFTESEAQDWRTKMVQSSQSDTSKDTKK